MALDVNEPTDQRMVGELPSYIRANRVTINAFEDVSGEVGSTDLTISIGTTALVVGVDLSVARIETVRIDCLGVSNINQIRGGTAGQLKIFIFGSNTISLIDGLKTTNGALYLNQLPVLSTFTAQLDDVIALTNVGGNGSDVYGYWKELWRQLSVK